MTPQAFAVCMAMDAFRIATLSKPRNFTTEEVMAWLRVCISAPKAERPPRTTSCSRCGGEGHIYSGHPNDPHPRYVGVCPGCNGSGDEPLEEDESEGDR